MSSVVLPYFFIPEESGLHYEIFRIKYNKDKIKDIKIKVELFNNYNYEVNETQYLDKFDLKNLDDFQFIKINYKEEYKAISLEIKLELKDDLLINDKPEKFNIKRIQSYYESNNYLNGILINIEVDDIHQFYFVNASYLCDDGFGPALYTNLMEKTDSKLYNGDFFEKNKIHDTLDGLLNFFNDKSFFSLVIYNKKTIKGFINVQNFKINNYEEVSGENRNTIYNQKIIINKHRENEHYYIIKNNNKKKEKIKLSITSSIKNFNITFYYLNDISNYSDLNVIFDKLTNKQNRLNVGKHELIPGDIEIFGYYCYVNEKEDKEIIISLSTENESEEDTDEKDKDNNKTLIIVLICVGAVIILVIVLFVIFKFKKKNSSVEIEDIGSNQPILEDK